MSEISADEIRSARAREALCAGLRERVGVLLGSRLNQCNETQVADSQGKARVAGLLTRGNAGPRPSASDLEQTPGGIKRQEGVPREDSQAMGIHAAEKGAA